MFFKNYKNVSVNSNTVKVNGRTIHLPNNYSSLSVIGDIVYVDGVRYDGISRYDSDCSEQIKDMKKIDFDETIVAISADIANVNVEIVKDSQSSISYGANEHKVYVCGGFIDIESKSDYVNTDITIHLSQKHLSSTLNLNIGYAGNIKFDAAEEELNTSLSLTTENGNIKANSNTTKDVTLHCENGNIKTYLNCCGVDIKASNGNIKGEIRTKEDGTVKATNGNIKLCTMSKITHRVKKGNVKIKNTVLDTSTIDAKVSNGNLIVY